MAETGSDRRTARPPRATKAGRSREAGRCSAAGSTAAASSSPSASSLAMLILIQEVVLRYVFNSPTIWAHETTIFLCGIAFVYGGLYCAARDSHIRVVLIYDAIAAAAAPRSSTSAISVICAAAIGDVRLGRLADGRARGLRHRPASSGWSARAAPGTRSIPA